MPEQAPIRLAIVSTPRTGNTWLRHLLSRIWALHQVAVHELTDEGWAKLPGNCVVQIHHPRESAFEQRLAAEGFRVITLARHPFDVLVSILHVAVYGVESERWLNGLHGDERSLWGAMPCSRAFREYAASPRAKALFDVSSAWWHAPGVTSIRYEDLVRDPQSILHEFERFLGPPRQESIETALTATRISNLRRDTGHGQHFWQGRPGLWRELIPASIAGELAQCVRPTLDQFGYSVEADPELTESQADRNWTTLFGEGLHATLQRNTELHLEQLREMQSRIEESYQAQKAWEQHYIELGVAKQLVEKDRDTARYEFAQMRRSLDAAEFRLGLIDGCGRFALRCARFVQACMNRLNRLRKGEPRRDAYLTDCLPIKN